jgi:uncharacterized protein
MEKLFQFSQTRINRVDTSFKRYLWDKVDWTNRLIAITGARGVGKTTLLLQYIKEKLDTDPGKVLFANMDDLWFANHSIVDLAEEFVKRGGTHLFLDEIHKYPNWSQEVKNVYDYFGDLNLVITGSSALNIYHGNADLSRRAILYHMAGMSFREFMDLKYNYRFPVVPLEQVLNDPDSLIREVLDKIRPIKMFEEYVQYGYYPFIMEGASSYWERLRQTINHVLETDLPSAEHIGYQAVYSLRKLLSVVAEMVPFKPNILKLSQQIGISRETLLKYLFLLERADLVLLLHTDIHGISRMNKPEKIYLNNPNMIFALGEPQVNTGSLSETVLYNQLQPVHQIRYSGKADFLVDDRFTIEVGGKKKSDDQIRNLKDAYIAADNIEYAEGNKIPLWLFGFLY